MGTQADEVECLKTGLRNLKDERDQLDLEINSLHAKNGDLDLNCANLKEDVENLRSQLHDQAGKAEKWYERSKELKQELECLKNQPAATVDSGAITILQKALELKANAGGAIKEEIKKALEKL